MALSWAPGTTRIPLIMIITEAMQIGDLLDLIHDYWFNVELVSLDRRSKSVTFHVEPNHDALEQGSSSGITVTVQNVDDLIIKDTERVRDYDINEITFDPATRIIMITGGIPIEIILRVSALEIHASPTVQSAATDETRVGQVENIKGSVPHKRIIH